MRPRAIRLPCIAPGAPLLRFSSISNLCCCSLDARRPIQANAQPPGFSGGPHPQRTHTTLEGMEKNDEAIEHLGGFCFGICFVADS
jgi:hypothetical protein